MRMTTLGAPGVYAQGTNACRGIGAKGRELLREMERLGMILDATHLCDDSFREALDHFRGSVWASHSNCRALVRHVRQFTDDQLISRDAVIRMLESIGATSSSMVTSVRLSPGRRACVLFLSHNAYRPRNESTLMSLERPGSTCQSARRSAHVVERAI
jgi:hypothetical protein